MAEGDRIRAFLDTLEKLPAHPGISFRGRPAEVVDRPGQTVVTQGLVATSRDARVALENFTVPSVYAVLGRTGRFIKAFSAAPEQEEVVFLPGRLFLLHPPVQLDGLEVVPAEELLVDHPAPAKTGLEAVLERVADALAEARLRADVAPGPPGKFVGAVD